MFHIRLIVTALRSLVQNLLRTLLATLGVIIGVGAVVAAVSILEGARGDILERFETLGADQLLVFNGSEKRSHRHTQTNSLVPDDAVTIEEENKDLVIASSAQYRGAGQIKFFEKNTYAAVLGTTAPYAEINHYEVVDGRFLTPQDVQAAAMVCVLGNKVREELFGPDSEEEAQHEILFEIQNDLETFPGPGWRRGYLLWRLVTPEGVPLRIYNAHTTANFAFLREWRTRMAQARELGLAIATVPSDEVVIAGGDLNGGAYYHRDVW